MAQDKLYNFREFSKILRNNGWYRDRVTGDHYIYKHDDSDKIITLSHPKGQPNKMVCKRLIKEHNLKL